MRNLTPKFFSGFFSNNISLSALAFGSKKDNPVYISQESGVIGLNFHQSKEVLIHETNGSNFGVSIELIFGARNFSN